MVDLVRVTCVNCGFEQILLIGTSNPDQTYNDLNDDFNYYKVFYCPGHHTFLNLEIFNSQNSSQQLLSHNHNDDRYNTELGCTNVIEVRDITIFTHDFPCPRCGTVSSLKIATKEITED